MSRVIPRQKTPELSVDTVAGGQWTLSEQTPKNFTLLVAYRGLHCPICKTYLADLNKNASKFADQGVNVFAVSTDEADRARQAVTDWQLGEIAVGYGMTIDTARQWGLYISTSVGKTSAGIEEPTMFSEPGVFFVRPDQTLYASNIQTMPFSRPHFRELLGALDVILGRNYPARGEA